MSAPEKEKEEEGGGGGRRVDERDVVEEEEQRPVEETETGTKDNKSSWIHFSSNKTPETSATYIKKFKDQTDFIFGVASVKKSGYVYGSKEKKPLKVILKSLYKEYYDKMMDGVLEFTTEKQLDEDVKNMFKRALQALAEKKRIDNAAPPYYYPKEGDPEPSKSVISQMVFYDSKGVEDAADTKNNKPKRLPILIYDPCIFELENGMKPSINDFHTSIAEKIKDYELVGLLDKELQELANLSDTEMSGGGKYVGGGVASLKEVLHQLNIELLKSNRYTPLKKGEIMDYSLTIAAMKERNQIRDFLKGRDFFGLNNDFITKLVNGPYGVRLDSQKRKDLLKVIIEYYASKTENYTIAKKEAVAVNAAVAAEKATKDLNDLEEKRRKNDGRGWDEDINAARPLAEENRKNSEKAAKEAAEEAAKKEENGIIFDMKDEEGGEIKPILFVDFLKDTIEPDNLKDGVTKLLKREGIEIGPSMYGNMKRSVKKGLKSWFGSETAEEKDDGIVSDEIASAAEETVSEDILLKYILNYGVWKLKSESSTDDKLFMIEPKTMIYLLKGTPTDGLIDLEMFLPINYTQKKAGGVMSSAEDAKPISMKTEKKENVKFYEKEFSYNDYKYEVTGQETQENLFEQSEWYIEYKKTQPTKQGGQSKNTTAKKNKSKRNKSKRNKSKKNK